MAQVYSTRMFFKKQCCTLGRCILDLKKACTPPPPPQCLGGSTFSSFSNCFRTRSFCIFCNSYTYSHPFLANLVLYKQIWPIYGYSHISMTKKQAKLSSNLKQLKKEDLIFPTSNFAFFLLNTSQTEDRRPKIPN